MKIINSYLFITAILFMSSCGYQLRGPIVIEGLDNVTIISNGYTSISRLLAQRLGSQNTSYTEDNKSYPIIKIISMSNQKRQLSVNSSGRVDEYEISKSINYELILSNDNKFVDTLTASASYDFNESQMQGTREQEMIANNVIDRTLIRKLVQKIKSTIRLSSQE
jgi:outer membrane lipopolysaccharide assembly protein LptE/RlpB